VLIASRETSDKPETPESDETADDTVYLEDLEAPGATLLVIEKKVSACDSLFE
jgi:hypothetical protein